MYFNTTTPTSFLGTERITFIAKSRPVQAETGDTIVHLTSVSNWQLFDSSLHKNYCGFRSSIYKSFNDLGRLSFTSLDTENKTATLSSAWGGSTIPLGATVVQSMDGNTYWYPSSIAKSATTDWVFVRKEFYGTTDGSTESWYQTQIFPTDARFMRFELYMNYKMYDTEFISDARLEIINDDGGVDDILHLV